MAENAFLNGFCKGLAVAFLFALNAVGCRSAARSPAAGPSTRPETTYNVRKFGAVGDGKTLDTVAINAAIDAASGNGGGTVEFPPGDYLSVSIRLKSNICLQLDHGSTIVAAQPNEWVKYDPAEPNPQGLPDPKLDYQDFGHSHWHNSLIWGENIQNIAIVGTGTIYGRGLAHTIIKGHDVGNKAIALKLCRNVIMRDVTIRHGGWFGILATGVDNMTIDNLKIDTNRDGMDIDACRDVRISNCSVNSFNDDAICLKSSYALGDNRPCENITITGCQVSGYAEDSMLDGTFLPSPKGGPTGRIKCGTESNGGFKNIAISNCVFSYSCGLALETVDGALLEDIAISNITMRDIYGAPIFLRLGSRMRGPAGTPVGQLRRVSIDNVVCYEASRQQGCLISGIPGHDIDDVKLSNITIYYRGGGTAKEAALEPQEREKNYPEPTMFGEMPGYGFFIRHANNLELNNVELRLMSEDARPPVVMNDVKSARFRDVRSDTAGDGPRFILKNVTDFSARDCDGIPDMKQEKIDSGKF